MADDVEIANRMTEATEKLKQEVRKVIIGQDNVLEQLLVTLFANHHCFIIGVPGLAKTLMISTLSKVLDLSFKRIQFTPDLMPADITGTEVIHEDPHGGAREFRFVKGPVFANIVLADEINRTPPKTQAALLEAMQERQVTTGNRTFQLDPPFFVLATQNPIEQEGTYPLPEAQLDRFLLNVLVGYPDEEEELRILQSTTEEQDISLQPVLNADDVLELQRIVRRVPVPDHVFSYALALIRRSRPEDTSAPDFVSEWIDFGAGPRAGQNLILAAKAHALIKGRFYVNSEDIKALALPVMRHRLVTNFNADAEGVRPDSIVRRLLEEIPEEENERYADHKT